MSEEKYVHCRLVTMLYNNLTLNLSSERGGAKAARGGRATGRKVEVGRRAKPILKTTC